ncbi:EamA-like_transporter family protein [Hexamita inflata]|uniref:EamA-like transporter family protein n=1 Tax=Hexamita inflata TaxID=28002 RepID=A0AA86RE63_9EUKA|nr:EamA-like transporter family protein [Hexamita inflata]
MGNQSGKYSKKAIIGILGMLIFGTGTMISAKLMLDTSACPIYRASEYPLVTPWEHGECPRYMKKKFEKPWYQTAVMFAAMSFCILGHMFNIFYDDKKAKQIAAAHARGEMQDVEEPKVVKHDWKAYTYIGVPALFDMAATTVMGYGLVLINVSIMQMLRGAMIVFATCFNVLFLKRKIRAYQWSSVCITVAALVLVGVACIMGSKGDTTAQPWNKQLLGCLLVVCSTAIQASQIVVEDFMLSDINATPLQIVGMEGIWGLIVTCAICWPIASFAIPGEDHGHMEDIADTFYMFVDNSLIIVFSVIYFIAILFLNWAGMVVTQETSSVVRTIFEAVRTAVIWIVDLMIYYWFAKHSVYGEAWNTYSWIQLAGFILLIFASQSYNGYAKYPMLFKYKFDDDKKKSEIDPLIQEVQE